MSQSVRSPAEVDTMVRTYGDMLFRICLSILKNPSDAEDAVQDTAIKYMQKSPVFLEPEHEKAWLIKVAVNECRITRRFWSRHPQISMDELRDCIPSPEPCEIVESLLALPDGVRIVMVLHYVEGYRTEEIAPMIGRSASAVKMRLQKGRKLLEQTYREERSSYGERKQTEGIV